MRYLLTRQVHDILAFPYQLLKFICARPVISQQASFVPPHRKMVDEHGARLGFVCMRFEAALEEFQHGGEVLVQVAHLPSHGTDELGLIGREIGQLLCSLRMKDLEQECLAHDEGRAIPIDVPHKLVAQVSVHCDDSRSSE